MKNKRGGKRIGAGRPKQEETVILPFRVLKEGSQELKRMIHDLINNYKKHQKRSGLKENPESMNNKK